MRIEERARTGRRGTPTLYRKAYFRSSVPSTDSAEATAVANLLYDLIPSKRCGAGKLLGGYGSGQSFVRFDPRQWQVV
jgi:hypothetical protein